MCQSRHFVIFILIMVLNYKRKILFEFLFIRNDNFSVILSMTDKIFDSFESLCFIDPNSLFSTHHITVFIVRFEKLSKFWWSGLDNLRRNLLQTGSWCTWSEIKLIDVDNSKFILINQIERTLEFIVCFLSEATNNISSDSDIRTMFQKVVTNFSKVFNWILSVHLFQNVIMSCLNWDMDESKDSWMVQEMGDCS